MDFSANEIEINGIKLVTVENEEHRPFVMIRPICDSLGLNYKAECNEMMADDVFKYTLQRYTFIVNGKIVTEYCLPFTMVFGWIYLINPKNVAADKQEAFLEFKHECAQVLNEHFYLPPPFSLTLTGLTEI